MLFWFYSICWTKEFKIFPSLFGLEKPASSIPNLAHLLLPTSDTNAIAKSKELNSLPFSILCASRVFAHLLPVSQRRFACGSTGFYKLI